MTDFDNSVGLENCGNSCYMNSTIQLLYSIKEFRYFIQYYEYNKDNKDNYIIQCIKNIFNKIENNKKKNKALNSNYLEPIYRVLFHQIFKINNFGSQQDAQEVLNYILDNIIDYYTEFNNTFIQNLLLLNLTKETYCKKNVFKYQIENIIDKCYTLFLEVTKDMKKPIKKSLCDLINHYQQEEKLETNLTRCNNQNSYIKVNIDIPDNNKYLIICLKRLLYNLYFDKSIEIDYTLSINNIKYKLGGIILRTGSPNSGHYIYATFKNKKIHKVYNDSVISNNLGHFNINKHSYVLLYKKIEKKNNNSDISQINNTLKNINTKLSEMIKRKNKYLELESSVIKKHTSQLIENNTKIQSILNNNKEFLTKLNNINYKAMQKQIKDNEILAIKLHKELNPYAPIPLKSNNINKQINENEILAKKLHKELNPYA
jgi:uncharacterized UBP type Zn finger protein